MELLIEAGQMAAPDYVPIHPDLSLASEGASTDAIGSSLSFGAGMADTGTLRSFHVMPPAAASITTLPSRVDDTFARFEQGRPFDARQHQGPRWMAVVQPASETYPRTDIPKGFVADQATRARHCSTRKAIAHQTSAQLLPITQPASTSVGQCTPL